MSLDAQAQAEGKRLLEAARLRNERALWGLIGPISLIAAGLVLYFRSDQGIATPWWLMAGATVLGICYVGLWLFWRKPIPAAMTFGFVMLECSVAFTMVAADATVDLDLARQTSGQVVPYVVVAFMGLRLRASLAIFSGIVSAVALLLIYPSLCPQTDNFYCEPTLFFWRPVLIMVAAVAVALTIRSGQRTFARAQREALKRMNVRQTLGQMVSEEVAETLLETDGLQGARRTATIAFVDLRNFTSFCAGRDADEVVRALNLILGELIEVMRRHNGVVNKFLGDGMLVLFGVPTAHPNHAQDALNAGLEAVEKTAELSAKLNAPTLQLGVGIHSGEVVAGTIGTADRMEYTVIGDTVNLASRIEGLNRDLGTTVLISSDTQKRLVDGANEGRACGEHLVKGREESVQVFAYGPPLRNT